MPVRSVNGLVLAAIAELGGVFSEMKFSVVPLNCFHIFESLAVSANERRALPNNAAPANVVPVIFRKSRRPIFLVIIWGDPCLRFNLRAPSLSPGTISRTDFILNLARWARELDSFSEPRVRGEVAITGKS